MNHADRCLTVQQMTTVSQPCEPERTQLLGILAMSVQNPQLDGYFLTVNICNFVYIEGSTAWFYDHPHFLPPRFEAFKSFDRIPVSYPDVVIFFHNNRTNFRKRSSCIYWY